MKLNDPVAVYTALNNFEARFACDALAEAGIEGFASELPSATSTRRAEIGVDPRNFDPPVGMYPQVWVSRADADRARPVLEEFARRTAGRRGDAAPAENADPVEARCQTCGKPSRFPAEQAGSVQECPHCGEFMDVGEGPGESGPPADGGSDVS
jgi:hypothetical protein